jgi:Family of unknown function (DUF6262)
MPRGNPDNLRAAAERKRAQATERAEAALAELVRSRQPVTFRGLAKAAGVSVDFLYRSPLRPRIEELRATAPITAAAVSAEQATASDSQIVRALAAQVRELKRRHHQEITELRTALAAAHGENLELRRRLGRDPAHSLSRRKPDD